MTDKLTDWKALCAELADALDEWQLGGGPPEDTADADLIARARTALAQPEPEGLRPDRYELGDAILRSWLKHGQDSWCSIADDVLAELPGLAQPEPEGVTDEEEWYPGFADWLEREMPEGTVIGDPLWWASKIADYLQRHARPTIKPVPVAERLPGPEDCFSDQHGQRSYKCWAQQYHTDNDGEPLRTVLEAWDLVDYRLLARCRRWYYAWLPHHALPLPQP